MTYPHNWSITLWELYLKNKQFEEKYLQIEDNLKKNVFKVENVSVAS